MPAINHVSSCMFCICSHDQVMFLGVVGLKRGGPTVAGPISLVIKHIKQCMYVYIYIYHIPLFYIICFFKIYIYIYTTNLIKARYDVLFIVLMSEPLTMFWCWGWTSACSKSALNPQKSHLALANSALFFDLIFPLKSDLPANWLVLLWTVFFV